MRTSSTNSFKTLFIKGKSDTCLPLGLGLKSYNKFLFHRIQGTLQWER